MIAESPHGLGSMGRYQTNCRRLCRRKLVTSEQPMTGVRYGVTSEQPMAGVRYGVTSEQPMAGVRYGVMGRLGLVTMCSSRL
jgi:hypothetical protein